jgi:hypothetical protein
MNVFTIRYVKNRYRIKYLPINLSFKKGYGFGLVGWNDVAGLVVLNMSKECSVFIFKGHGVK